MADDVAIRPVRLDDLPEINKLISGAMFDVGAHILTLYFLNSSADWRVAVNEKGEIVAVDSVHILPLNSTVFGFNTFVRSDYRRRGIIHWIYGQRSGQPELGNATGDSMHRLPAFQSMEMKLVGFTGPPIVDLSIPVKLDQGVRAQLLLDEKDTDELLAYDRQVYQLDRTGFTRQWCLPSKPGQPYSRTLLARRTPSGRIAGYATIRLCSDYYSIMPLYADDQSIAVFLFNEIVRLFIKECKDESIYVFFAANNRLMMELVHRWKLDQCDSEVRQYSNGASEIKKYIRFDRVYALHEYWPV